MKNPVAVASLAAIIGATLSACTHEQKAETPRPVRVAEIRYDQDPERNRYVGTVQVRREVDQAFRVGGKIVQRRVDVGQSVREGEVIAILDDTDYRLAEEAARQQAIASAAQARQADSDRKRLAALKVDGSVSASDEERADSNARTSLAAAAGDAKKLDLARNRLAYTVLRASQAGVITAVRFEAGQIVAEGQPVVSVANPGEPEIVVDVPEDQLEAFKTARYKASLARAPEEGFDVTLRELSPQAAAQTRTYRARLKPASPRSLPLGATATLFVQSAAQSAAVASVPSAALTQSGVQPALWIVHRADGTRSATVQLTPVTVHGYRNDDALVSGPQAGDIVVTAGVQKMAPGLQVALPTQIEGTPNRQASR
jgi:membrane fusion protein, multidrug efflux system